ncbi:LOW QUALITY PROTEIN: flotillin-2 isoform X3 [Vespula squamosa]|uniref:Flotillin-2 isoform X3 n=1 Tax=Vespula squamosa TaxID=30214 RepID=A0ABD2A897_VESSQ
MSLSGFSVRFLDRFLGFYAATCTILIPRSFKRINNGYSRLIRKERIDELKITMFLPLERKISSRYSVNIYSLSRYSIKVFNPFLAIDLNDRETMHIQAYRRALVIFQLLPASRRVVRVASNSIFRIKSNIMPLDIEMFISEIEKRSAIYNTKLKEYSDKNLKKKLWIELCEKFVDNWNDLSTADKDEKNKQLQKKWKNLRTCFKREYDEQKSEMYGSGGKKRHKYLYFDQLLFLRDFIESRKISSNSESTISNRNDIENVIEETEDINHVSPVTSLKPTANVTKRKKISNNTFEESLLQMLREKNDEEKEIDEDKYFLLSLLPSFRKLNEEQKFIARIEIMNVMRRLRLPEYHHTQTDSRGCCGSMKKKTIVGGYVFTWWFVTDVQRLSLEVMTLNPVCENVETAQGVPLTVTGVAQCKIMKADELLHTASEQFLGKSVHEIKSTILSTLEGHLRAILGTLSVEEVYKDRDQFAALVREVAAPDVGRMGIEILSFTIKDVYDDVQYLASLGKAQTAAVKRDADVGVAEANRDAGIREAECEKAAMDIKYNTDTKIEDNARLFQLQKANFDQEVNTAKAEAQLAYELQAAKIRQRIRNEEIQIEIVERRKQIEVEEQEVRRKEHELQSTVRLPAEAEHYKIGKVAEGKRTQTVSAAKAEAERIRLIGEAEAQALEAVGISEAERMRMKAAIYKKYGEAAILNIALNALPKIAAEVAAPLARTEEIVLLGGNDTTSGEITRLVGQVPPAVQALTGVDLSKVLGKIPGANH